VVRNMMTTRDGNIVIAESGVNKVALVESDLNLEITAPRRERLEEGIAPRVLLQRMACRRPLGGGVSINVG
jgi:hypothetical protein